MVKSNTYIVEALGFNQREKYEEVVLRFIEHPDSPKFDELPSERLEKGAKYIVTFKRVENNEEPFNQ